MKKRLSFDCQLVCVFTWKLPLIDGVRQYAGFKILQLLLIQLQKRPVFVSRHNAYQSENKIHRSAEIIAAYNILECNDQNPFKLS
jgi:hypothetical protein